MIGKVGLSCPLNVILSVIISFATPVLIDMDLKVYTTELLCKRATFSLVFNRFQVVLCFNMKEHIHNIEYSVR